MKRFTLILLILSFLLLNLNSSFAREWDSKKDVDIEARYSIGYDSNILEFSDNDIDRFENNTLPGHNDLSTYDDAIQSFALRLRMTSKPWLGNRKARLYYTIGYQAYMSNSQSSRVSHSLLLTHDITKKIDFVGSYFFIPSRYLRDYYDRDWQQYFPCEFDYHTYSAGLRFYPVKKLRLDVRYEGAQVYYNKWFTEYDSESYGLRLSGRYTVNKKISINTDFRLRWADNVGFDDATDRTAPSGTDEDAEFGDGSYGEEYFEYGFSWALPLLEAKDLTMDISHRLRHRYYTSDLDILEDPFHRGREHMHQRIFLGFDMKFNSKTSGGPEFEYEWRKTESPYDSVPRVKDFSTTRIWFHLRYDLW